MRRQQAIGYGVWGMGVVLLILSLVGIDQAQAASSVCAKDVCVSVEVVSELLDMQKGLQGREGLKENQGMLFVFDTDDFHNFWMKDMKFAIDIIWVNNQYRIAAIAPSREPCAQDPCEVYASSQKARYVLEVPAGFVLKHQLRQGDVLKFNL